MITKVLIDKILIDVINKLEKIYHDITKIIDNELHQVDRINIEKPFRVFFYFF